MIFCQDAVEGRTPEGLSYRCASRSDACVGLAAEELAGAGAANEFAGVDDRLAAGENGFWYAGNLDSFEHRVVHTHVMRCGADDLLFAGVEDDDVSVGAYRDSSLAWEEAEKFCGRCRDYLHETVCGEAFAVDATGVDQAETMLDAGAAVGDFGEVVFAHFFLLLEAKRAVIGGDDLQGVAREALPEFFLMPFFAQGWSEDIFGAFKAGGVHVFEREIEILRVGLGVGGEGRGGGSGHFLEGLVEGEVDGVTECRGHFGAWRATAG